jgi:drug/metabolite transporter (DMT)-like permease
MTRTGTLFCLSSAAAFGAMGVVGKLAYAEGATVGTLLATRFALAAALFWVLLVTTGRCRELRALTRRDLVFAVALGAVGYSLQAGFAFAALERLDASLFSLLLYTFPIFVTVAAIALRREPASRRTAGALALASAGLVLVLAGAVAGALNPLSAALALAAAVVYSVYILASEGISVRLDPLVLSTLLCTGAAATLTWPISAAAIWPWARSARPVSVGSASSRSFRRWERSRCSSQGSAASGRPQRRFSPRSNRW